MYNNFVYITCDLVIDIKLVYNYGELLKFSARVCWV